MKNERDKQIEGSSYAYFKEYEDYPEITHTSSEISFVPKRNELTDVIRFAKPQISNKGF